MNQPHTVPASDLRRADAAVAFFRLCGPHDAAGEFRYPTDPAARQELADFVYDVTGDVFAARAVLAAPKKRVVRWGPPPFDETKPLGDGAHE